MRRTDGPRLGGLALLLYALSAFAPAGFAQEASTGIVADRLRPGLGPSTLAAAEGADTTPRGHVGVLLALGYLRDPIVLRTADGAIVSRPVRGQLVGTLGWELGLPGRFALRVSLPVALWNDGDRLRNTGVELGAGTDRGPGLAAAAGDLQLGLKVALLGSPTAPGMHAALALDFTAPMGGQEQFAATGGVTIAPRLMLDYRLPWLTLVLDAAVRFSPERRLFTTSLGDELVLAGGVIARFAALGNAQRWHLQGYVEGSGAIALSSAARPGELRTALRVTSARGISIDLGGGAGLVDALGAPRYRLFAMVRVPLAPAW